MAKTSAKHRRSHRLRATNATELAHVAELYESEAHAAIALQGYAERKRRRGYTPPAALLKLMIALHPSNYLVATTGKIGGNCACVIKACTARSSPDLNGYCVVPFPNNPCEIVIVATGKVVGDCGCTTTLTSGWENRTAALQFIVITAGSARFDCRAFDQREF
jgi:hypothetical protein